MSCFDGYVAIGKRLACAAVASASLSTSASMSHANEFAAVSAGPATMLRLQVPLSGASSVSPQPKLTLSAGSSWRDAPGAVHPLNSRFVPSMEAGFTLGGSPILSLGSIDLMKNFGARMNASSEPGSVGDNRAFFLIGAVVAVGLVVWAVNGAVDSYERLDELYDDPKDQ